MSADYMSSRSSSPGRNYAGASSNYSSFGRGYSGSMSSTRIPEFRRSGSSSTSNPYITSSRSIERYISTVKYSGPQYFVKLTKG